MSKKKLLILALVIVAVGMGVGYSILSKQLKVEGTATLKSNFDVAITNIRREEYFLNNIGYGDSIFPAPEPYFVENSEPSFTSTTATFDVTLNSSGVGAYVVTLKNTGDECAVLNDVNIVSENEALLYETPINLDNAVLNPGASVKYLVIINGFNSNVEASEETAKLTITFDFKQLTANSETSIIKPYITFGAKTGNPDGREINIINSTSALFSGDADIYISVDNGEFEKYRTILISDMPSGGLVPVAYPELSSGWHELKYKVIIGNEESNEIIESVYIED